MNLFNVFIAAALIFGIVGVIIVWRGNAIDKDKAKAALQSAEARTENTLTDWFKRLLAHFK